MAEAAEAQAAIPAEVTANTQATDKFTRYTKWLRDNGVVFPHLSYPAYFGPEPDQMLGVAATELIPPKTAFMFIPYKLIMSSEAALASELSELYEQHPALFKDRPDSLHLVLYLFLMLERLKGEASFWSAYLDTAEEADLVRDWAEPELAELQDPVLFYCAVQEAEFFQETWEEVYTVIQQHPNFFPGTKEELYQVYKFASNMVTSRAFGCEFPGYMIAPFADNLNHHNVGVYNGFFEESELIANENGEYGAFSLQDTSVPGTPQCNVDVSGVEGMGQYANSYFTLSTGRKTSFETGAQVFNCYGNRNNQFLLQTYGFVLEDNIYDSIGFRVWRQNLCSGYFSPQDEINGVHKAENSELKLDEATIEFRLKASMINPRVIEYFRKEVRNEMQLGEEVDKKEVDAHSLPKVQQVF